MTAQDYLVSWLPTQQEKVRILLKTLAHDSQLQQNY